MPTAADDPNNVGGDGKNTASGGAQGDPGQTPPGGTGSGDGSQTGTKPENAGGDEKKFAQSDLDALAAKVRDEERRKHEAKLKSERDETERKQREQQGEYQKLYEAEKAKNDELMVKATRADDYAKRINEVVDGEVKDWPAEVKRTDPGAEQLDARLQWVETHRDLAKRLITAGAPPNFEHGRQGRGATKTADVTDKYLNAQYSRPGQAAT